MSAVTRTDLNHFWDRVRAEADLDDVRRHDLRHGFASRALALGESLSMIGHPVRRRRLDPTGAGKTFIACALAHQACRQKRSVLCRRVPERVAALARARDKGTHDRLMKRLARVDLLLLDDWGLQGFSAEGRRDLLEIVEARHGRKSILIASQIPVEHWPKVIGEPTIADAVLDRIVHNAYRIDLTGQSQRKRTSRHRSTAATKNDGAQHRASAPACPIKGLPARRRHLCMINRARLRSQPAGLRPAP